jgi:hypothetical protein
LASRRRPGGSDRTPRDVVATLHDAARGARWSLRNRLGGYPSLFLPLARTRYPDAVVGDETELLIDGFTRSAVTFAVIAFQMAQRRPVRVAHTLHAAGHVIESVERGLPTLVTVRDPDDAVLSAVIREPYVSLAEALAAYARFHERISSYRAGYVMAPFDRVTADFGSVIRDLNERFGTAFDEFEHTPGNVDECFGIIEDRGRWPPWAEALGRLECGIIGIAEYRRIVAATPDQPSGAIPEMRVPRPSTARDASKAALRSELERPRLGALRARARRAFERASPR